MKKIFSIIGGDLRIKNLAQLLTKDNNMVYLYGQENTDNTDNLVSCTSIEEAIKKSDIIVSSIPFSKDGINVYAPFSKDEISIKDLVEHIDNKVLLAGSISENFYEAVKEKNVEIIDLMEQEDLTILNTIATAEGAISEIILNTTQNIHGSHILILGFGRVSKVLAYKLKALDAIVTCAARKDKDFAWMEALGFKKTNINKLEKNLQEYDVIINTVPNLILDQKRLEYVRKDCLLIDLASKPGGIDENACTKMGIKFIWALAIPGKVAPKTSAEYIKNTIYNILEKGI